MKECKTQNKKLFLSEVVIKNIQRSVAQTSVLAQVAASLLAGAAAKDVSQGTLQSSCQGML